MLSPMYVTTETLLRRSVGPGTDRPDEDHPAAYHTRNELEVMGNEAFKRMGSEKP